MIFTLAIVYVAGRKADQGIETDKPIRLLQGNKESQDERPIRALRPRRRDPPCRPGRVAGRKADQGIETSHQLTHECEAVGGRRTKGRSGH